MRKLSNGKPEVIEDLEVIENINNGKT